MRGVAGDRMAGSGEPVASEPVASERVASGRWSVAGGRSQVAGWLAGGRWPVSR